MAILREWGLFSLTEITGLRDELLGFALSRQAELISPVFKSLLKTVAVMYKRASLDDASQAMGEIRAQITQLVGAPESSRCAIALCTAIVVCSLCPTTCCVSHSCKVKNFNNNLIVHSKQFME